MKRFVKIISVLATSTVMVGLTGCSEYGGPLTKQNIGTVVGAVGGAAAGSQFGKGTGNTAMIALGTLAGAAAGSSLGASLDKIDQEHSVRTSQNALETAKTGQTMTWRNPDSGNSGAVTPTRTYQQANGSFCREFSQSILIDGRRQDAYGTACRQPDGSWKIVSQQ